MASERRALAWLGGAAIAATIATAGVACSSAKGSESAQDAGGAADGGGNDVSSIVETGSGDAGPDARDGAAHAPDASDATVPTCITPTTPQSCSPPVMTALPICKLSQTGCMDPTEPTKLTAKAVYYEVNSPLWSDDAAKTRAFVLPAGGKIHVKDCDADASADAMAECVSPAGIPSGPADTGKWVFPVGTVMIKNFMFDGKLVETRLLMRVDAATAAIIGNGTDWVGYNYAWNEQQTEATVVPDTRTSVMFATGQRTVAWNYPSFIDCVACHSAAVGTIGPENDQMNRVVDGGNQLATFVAMGLFDNTAPAPPYGTAMVEPYANAALGLQGPPPGTTVDQEARSYLAANCGFCHRPDVNDQGFDLRFSLTLHQTGICGLMQQNGLPSMPNTNYVDMAPGNHAASAMWIRMNIPVPASDPGEYQDVGRMPPVSSFIVDPQATALIGQWIDSFTSCP